MQSRSLDELLSSADGMARFASHAKNLLRLQTLLANALPPALRASARVANLRQGRLVLHATNSAVAAKLRQMAPRVAEYYERNGVQLSEIDIRTQAGRDISPKIKRTSITGPSQNREQALTDLSQRLPDDAALKAPLQRLLKTLRER